MSENDLDDFAALVEDSFDAPFFMGTRASLEKNIKNILLSKLVELFES